MKLTFILLICGFACGLGFQRGGSGMHSRPHGGNVHAFHAPPKMISRPAPRPHFVNHVPKAPHIRPVVRPPTINHFPKVAPKPLIKPALKVPHINPMPKAVPKPHVKPVVIAKAPHVNALPKIVPKPQVKPVVIAKPPPVKPVSKAVPKPQVKPVVIAKAPPVKTVSKAVPKPQVKPVVPIVKPLPISNNKPQIKPAAVAKTPVAKTLPKAVPKPQTKPVVSVKPPPVKPVPKVDTKPQIKPAVVAKPPPTKVLPKVDPKVQTKPAIAVAPAKTPVKPSVPKVPNSNPSTKDTPKTHITGSVNSSPGQGTDMKFDAKHNVWTSKNERHSLDATAGVTKHSGGPQGNTKPDVRLGAEYSYNSPKTQISASANKNPSGKGVDLNANAQQNLWQSKNERHSIDAIGGISKTADTKKLDTTIGAQYNFNAPKTQVSASAMGGPGKGVDFNVDAKQNIWQSKDERHSIDAVAGVSKHVGGLEGNGKPDLSYGGQYKYQDPKTQITASAMGGPQKGVQLSLDAQRKLWESDNKRSSIDLTGGVSKQIGGPNGGGKPEAQVGVQFSHDF